MSGAAGARKLMQEACGSGISVKPDVGIDWGRGIKKADKISLEL